MNTKRCAMCGEQKEANHEEFAWKNKSKGWLQPYCRECQKIYRKKHYEDNRQKYIDKASVWRKELKKEFYQWLATKECSDCGISDIRVLEFDHVRGNKSGIISQMLARVSKEKLLEELEKCDIVCANCHRIRTAKQFNYFAAVTQLVE